MKNYVTDNLLLYQPSGEKESAFVPFGHTSEVTLKPVQLHLHMSVQLLMSTSVSVSVCIGTDAKELEVM